MTTMTTTTTLASAFSFHGNGNNARQHHVHLSKQKHPRQYATQTALYPVTKKSSSSSSSSSRRRKARRNVGNIKYKKKNDDESENAATQSTKQDTVTHPQQPYRLSVFGSLPGLYNNNRARTSTTGSAHTNTITDTDTDTQQQTLNNESKILNDWGSGQDDSAPSPTLDHPALSNVAAASPSTMVLNDNTTTSGKENNNNNKNNNNRTPYQPKHFFSTWTYPIATNAQQPEDNEAAPLDASSIHRVDPSRPKDAASTKDKDWLSSQLLLTNNSNKVMALPPKPSLSPLEQPPLLVTVLANRNPEDVLTVKDLQDVIRLSQQPQQQSWSSSSSSSPLMTSGPQWPNDFTMRPLSQQYQSSQQVQQQQPPQQQQQSFSSKQRTSTSKKSKKGVAFPQQSVLSYRDVTWGTTVSAAMVGMILAMTVFPNLWLMGGLASGIYGRQLSQRYAAAATSSTSWAGQDDDDDDDSRSPHHHVVDEFLIVLGRKAAKAVLTLKDTGRGIWFMYQTGQLSYAYYQQYAQLDERWAITSKIDAWNARFMEGKRQFDQWEQENEIGRKVLASLRTVWWVDERAKGRTGIGKYRIVQYMRRAGTWCRQYIARLWNGIRLGNLRHNDLLKGISISISQQRLEEVLPRMGAAMGAFLVLQLVGALFAIAPSALGLLAILTGLVWPTWTSELGQRVSVLLQELKAQGRHGKAFSLDSKSMQEYGNTRHRQPLFYDKTKYSFFTRQDGSKQWYRTGKSGFRARDYRDYKERSKAASSSWSLFPWQQQSKKKSRRPAANEHWGIFGW